MLYLLDFGVLGTDRNAPRRQYQLEIETPLSGRFFVSGEQIAAEV